jgi:hypothetical protein
MRVRVFVRNAAMLVRRRVNGDRNEADVTVGDAAFGDDRLGEFSDLGGISPKHGDFQATFMIEMDVHRGDLQVVMGMVRVGQALGEFARVMVEDIGERRNAIPCHALIDAGALEAKAREITNSLGSIVVAVAFHERGQFRREFIGHADRDPLHEAAPADV